METLLLSQPRRRLMVALVSTLSLSACMNKPKQPILAPPEPAPAPPAPPAKVESYAERLRRALPTLGFTEIDEGWLVNLPAPLLFNIGADTLRAEAVTSIQTLSAQLAELGVKRLRVLGYTDNTGTEIGNAALSERRAATVAQEFVKHGFSNERIERQGFGQRFPVASNDTAEGRAQNRRVAVIVPTAE